VFFLDEPLASAIDRLVRFHPALAGYAGNVPDVLLPVTLFLSAGMWTAWYLRVRKGIRDDLTRFFRLGGTALPASYLAKTALKVLFGRIETRVWLENPAPRDFRWLHPGTDHWGFPSGHMMVFAALAAACWIHFPKFRGASLLFLLALGSALLLTNYHFLGDVVAGGYLGMAVTAASQAALEGRPG